MQSVRQAETFQQINSLSGSGFAHLIKQFAVESVVHHSFLVHLVRSTQCTTFGRLLSSGSTSNDNFSRISSSTEEF